MSWQELLSMIGNGLWETCYMVLFSTLFSYAIGGGGLGALAINYGYYRYRTDILLVVIVVLVLLVQIIQLIGTRSSRLVDHRLK